MLKPLEYNYRGQPLTPYGKGRSRYGRRKKSPVFFISAIIVLLLLAGLCFLWYRSARKPAVPKENTEVIKEKEPVETVSAAPSVSNEPEAAAERAVSADIQEQNSSTIEQNYQQAEQLFQSGEYDKCREILRQVIEKSNIKAEDPLYAKSCDMLGRASMFLLTSGGDPANWVEYTVAPGNNLSVLANKFHTNVKAIREANQLTTDSLRVGQRLRIPQCTWSVRIERKMNRVLLDNNGKLFKVYGMYAGPGGKNLKSGSYVIKYKQTHPEWKKGSKVIAGRSRQNPLGSRWLGFTCPDMKGIAGIHGTTRTTKQNDVWFALSELDVQDLYKLVPSGTKVEILD